MRGISDHAASFGIDLSAAQLAQFASFMNILLDCNTRINLTRITDPQEIELKHFADSIAILPYLTGAFGNGSEKLNIADVGTGAGFPGIPLKIAKPLLKLTLIDSLKKRVDFLNEVIKLLGLEGVQNVHSRAEDAGRAEGSRDTFDIAVARAVASLPELCEYCLPLVRPGGIFAAMKANLGDEVKLAGQAIRELGGETENIHEYYLPGTDIFRSLVIIRKITPTPPEFPRKAGKPSAQPLGIKRDELTSGRRGK